jgi:putative membrane protein insertion efficiency factor
MKPMEPVRSAGETQPPAAVARSDTPRPEGLPSPRAWGLLRLWPRRVLQGCVRGYQLLLSAHMGQQCRFTPTCSNYALQALDRHGALAGSYLAARRILRCHPWCEGGRDDVPHNPPPVFGFLSAPAARRQGRSARSSPESESSP